MKSINFYNFIQWKLLSPTLTCGLMLLVATVKRDRGLCSGLAVPGSSKDLQPTGLICHCVLPTW